MNLFLFILSPFFAFLNSLRDLKSKSNAIVFILFCAVMGYSFSFQLTTADSFRYAYYFYIADISVVDEVIQNYRFGGSPDLYLPVCRSLVKSFTNNPKVLFAVLGLVFGSFCYLSIRTLIKERIGKNNLYFGILMIVFFCFNSILNINGVRFWTATWVFFYFLIQYMILDNKKAILGCLIVPLIHWSYIPFAILAVLVKVYLIFFRRNPLKILYIVFLLSFFTSFVMPESTLQDALDGDTEIIEGNNAINRKFNAYSDKQKKIANKREVGLYRTANSAINIYHTYAIKIMAFIQNVRISRKE